MYENIEFVICAAGECTRNYPHSKAVAHKTLLPMGDKRIIDYVLQEILQIGGRHITFVCSNQAAVEAFQKALKTNEPIVQKLRTKKLDLIADVVEETFLPPDTDLKFVIQEEPLGTAHVLYVARDAIQDRHVVLIFPDDIWMSADPEMPHIKRLVDAFLQNPKTALITSMWSDNASEHAILVNNRIIEKQKDAKPQMTGWDPNVLPNEVIQFLIQQAPQKMAQARETKKEWYYMDAINDFLDQGGENDGFKVDFFPMSEHDEMLDTGNLWMYEQSQLKMLLTRSKNKEQNQQLAKQLLE